jgi:hypothetical protein
MTFEEALALTIKTKEKWGGGSSEAWLINALEVLGILKLEDRRSADERLAESLSKSFSFDADAKEMDLFRERLAQNGLKIVVTTRHSPQGSEATND